MSVAEELHRTIDVLSEEQQQRLLNTARAFLQEQSGADRNDPDYETLLKQLLIKRYEQYKTHPETGVSAEEASRRIRLKYGWTK